MVSSEPKLLLTELPQNLSACAPIIDRCHWRPAGNNRPSMALAPIDISGCMNGSIRSCSGGRLPPSCHPERQCAALHSRNRCRAKRLPRSAGPRLGALRRRTTRVLLDVESRSLSGGAEQAGRVGAQLEANARPIRWLLECGESFQRPCLAGALLFLSAG